jgi:RES domain-containing protein
MMAIHIPDKLEMETITTHQLTESWFSYDDISQDVTRKLGEDWLLKQRTAVLKVPSAIVPQEFNYLINPMARDAADIKIIDIREYHYEDRYKGLLTTRTP